MLLVTAEEMREIDRQAIETIGIPGVVLMENAGAQVAREVMKLVPNNHAKIVIIAGRGNNGGDGFVIARHLGNHSYDVETWVIGDINKFSKDSAINFHALVHSGYRIKIWAENNEDLLMHSLDQADVVVDAMLGTGAVGRLREPYKSIVQYANQVEAIRVAVDIPSGVNSNTGEIVDTAFQANVTVTFAYPKIGQYLYPGADYIGKLVIADIAIPEASVEKDHIQKHLITNKMVKDFLHPRKKNSHKGTYGHALLIGGSKDMPGAPTLATVAAMRSGAGLTTIAVPNTIQSMVFTLVPEAICIGLSETATGNFSLKSVDELKVEEQKYTALGIGPGIGKWGQGRDFILRLLETNKKAVIDADGLNLIASDLSPLKNRTAATILTPHPGEMARLLQKTTKYVEKNRVDVARDLATMYGIYVVLKGAHTIIALPNGEIFVNSTGGPELAKGGTGDVLTGMIVGFLAQQIPVKEALILAVYLHGLAGTLSSYPSDYSTIATEIIDNIGSAIHHTMSNHAT